MNNINYYVNHKAGTVTIANHFAERAGNNVIGKESKELNQIFERYSDYKIRYRKSVSPVKETHKGLTLYRMEKYIKRFETPAALSAFEQTKEYNTDLKETKSGDIIKVVNYGKVKKWFLSNYAEYKEKMIQIEEEADETGENSNAVINSISESRQEFSDTMTMSADLSSDEMTNRFSKSNDLLNELANEDERLIA